MNRLITKDTDLTEIDFNYFISEIHYLICNNILCEVIMYI